MYYFFAIVDDNYSCVKKKENENYLHIATGLFSVVTQKKIDGREKKRIPWNHGGSRVQEERRERKRVTRE